MNKFTQKAQEMTSKSPLLNGKTKYSTDEMIKAYPDGFTIIAFDLIEGNNAKGEEVSYPIFNIAENETVVYFGGTVLKKICQGWLDMFDGDIEEANNELKKDGVKVKLSVGRTKKGNNIVNVEILED